MSAKSLFVSAALTFATLAAGYGAFVLLGGGWPPDLGWLGVILVSAPFVGMIGRLMLLKDVARTSDHLPVLWATTAIGVGLAVLDLVLDLRAEVGPSLALPVVLLSAGGFVAYDLWYSRLPRTKSDDLAVGRPLPEFELYTPEGDAVPPEQLRHSTLLVFYRGNWCPLCMAQVKEIAAQYRELERRGVAVVMVSPQPPDHSARLAERFDAPMRFLVDREGAAARRLGIHTSEGVPAGMEALGYSQQTVLPTVVLTDAQGEVIYLDETDNYRVRPEPATFLAALDANGGAR